MTDEIIIRRLRSTLSTIYLEAKEPIVKAMAESVLRETMPQQPQQLLNEHCKKHFWFGISGESCPICIEQKKNDQSQRK